LTLVMALAAQAIIAGLTIGFAGHVDPLRDPVSDYTWHRGGRFLFTPAVLLLLAAAGTLAVAARLAALPRARMGERSRALVARHDIDGVLSAFETQYRILAGLPTAAAPAA
jgi:hypothetical protein